MKGKTEMAQQRLGIIMNGVTGRMGTNQHLVRSILAIRSQGGVPVGPGEVLWPEPVLVGRDERALADCDVYFDAQVTSRREAAVRAAIAAGRHVYCEKPLTEDLGSALELAQ